MLNIMLNPGPNLVHVALHHQLQDLPPRAVAFEQELSGKFGPLDFFLYDFCFFR